MSEKTENQWCFQAEVVCRQLGYDRVDSVFGDSSFGEVSAHFSYDDLECDGSEATLDDCYYYYPANCGTGEGAGVRCASSGTSTTTEGPIDSTTSGSSDHYGN